MMFFEKLYCALKKKKAVVLVCIFLVILSFGAGVLFQSIRNDVQTEEALAREIFSVQSQLQSMTRLVNSGHFNADNLESSYYILDIPQIRYYAGRLKDDLCYLKGQSEYEESVNYLENLTRYLLMIDFTEFDQLYHNAFPLIDFKITSDDDLESVLLQLDQKLQETSDEFTEEFTWIAQEFVW